MKRNEKTAWRSSDKPGVYRVASAGSDPWEGSLTELLDANPDLPEFVTRRIQRLNVGERVSFAFPDTFIVERVNPVMPLMTREAAEEIYALLVDEADASKFEREHFVWYHAERPGSPNLPTEWRFQGKFGFGGKFYVEPGKWRVGYYGREDFTEAREELRETLNVKIANLRDKHLGDV